MSTTIAPLKPADALPASVADKLFDRLDEYLGGKMADLYAGVSRVSVKESWARALAGFSREELARGVAAVSERAFAPTLGEFKRLCRPALDPELAWHEAADGLSARSRGKAGAWTHPAVYRAATRMSPEVRAGDLRACRKRWEYTLSRELEAGWGEGIPEVPKQIEQQQQGGVACPPDVRRGLADLARRFKSFN